jgi:CBS domain-containing protein
MSIGEVCSRNVIYATREATVAAAAKLMRQHHVGDVVVIHQEDAERMPIGIVTDRDIVVEVVALGVDPVRRYAGRPDVLGRARDGARERHVKLNQDRQ